MPVAADGGPADGDEDGHDSGRRHGFFEDRTGRAAQVEPAIGEMAVMHEPGEPLNTRDAADHRTDGVAVRRPQPQHDQDRDPEGDRRGDSTHETSVVRDDLRPPPPPPPPPPPHPPPYAHPEHPRPLPQPRSPSRQHPSPNGPMAPGLHLGHIVGADVTRPG